MILIIYRNPTPILFKIWVIIPNKTNKKHPLIWANINIVRLI